MTELEKYELVNSSETIEDLQAAILNIANDNIIDGRNDTFDADRMAANVIAVVRHDARANLLTRKYGIRQQALYLQYYEK